MKDRAHPVEGDADARARSLCDLGAAMAKQRLDVGPFNVRTDRVGENRLKCPVVLVHPGIVSFYDTAIKKLAVSFRTCDWAVRDSNP